MAMLTQREKSQLIEDYERRPVSAVGLLTTCAVSLLLVVLVALVGIDIHSFGNDPAVKQATVQSR